MSKYQKLSPVVGTNDQNAFILSLRNTEDLNNVHSYGIHSIPHVGVYGTNYALALPIVLLSLPPSLSCLKQLPPDILNALDTDLKELYNRALLDAAKKIVQAVFSKIFSRRQLVVPKLTISDHEFVTDTSSSECPQIETKQLQIEGIDFIEVPSNEEDMLRLTAKKLVRKIICSVFGRQLDRRRSSIEMEYLVESAKRLKLESPSPETTPPLSPDQSLLEKSEADDQLSQLSTSFKLKEEELARTLGKRRQRSESHDATSMKDINVFQQKHGITSQQNSSTVDHPFELSLSKISEMNNDDELINSYDVVSSLDHQGRMSITNLIVNMRGMSIIEDHENNKEEEYTVLEAVTKPVEAQPNYSPVCIDDPALLCHPDNHMLLDMDYYIILHAHPLPSLCQKFLCNNTNEVNVLFHFWLFKDIVPDPSMSLLEHVNMGLFNPEGVGPVHLDLQDGGIPFYYLEDRTVCIHNLCLSPENAQLQLNDDALFHSFFSVASHGDRKVITFHIIPSNKCLEERISQAISECNTLQDLLVNINGIAPIICEKLYYLLSPCL